MGPVFRPGAAHVAAEQNIGVVARLFILDVPRVRVLACYFATRKKLLRFLQIETREDHRLRETRIVAAVPKRISEAHGMRQAKGGSVKIERAAFAVVPCQDSGASLFVWRQRMKN